MPTSPSRRAAAMQTPIIPIVADMIRQHPGTISLGQGVVFYGPPPQVQGAVARFFDDAENHKYKPVHGLAPLREVIAAKLLDENKISLHGSALVVTGGSNMAFTNALLAIADVGDEIILPSPFYFNHEMAIDLAGCRLVAVPMREDYQLDIAALRAAITPKTRALVTVSPNNPTGAVYAEATLREVNALCRDTGIYHISDEAYEYFTYDGTEHFSPGSIEGAAGHTISLFSLSKAYGFASWRIGYMTLPEPLFEATRKIQDTILICPPVVSQCAAMGALQAGRAYCESYLGDLNDVRLFAQSELQTLGAKCEVPLSQGAFYYLLRLQTSLPPLDLVERLIREYGVAAIPGTTFGLHEGCFLRVAYGALQKQTAQEGIGRLVRGLKAIL
jgi:aspartate/methionine/tyrosine aminotransferase